MIRFVPIALLFAMLAPAVPAFAQMGVEEGPSDDFSAGADQGDQAASSPQGSVSLAASRDSGTSVRIGGSHNLAPRRVPDTYTVRRGDTLWDITGHFYGDPYQWPRVWSYNPDITNPHWIYPQDTVHLTAPGHMAAHLPAEHHGPAVVQRRAVPPGSVYLRSEGFLDQDALHRSGEIVGSPTDHMMLSPSDEVYVRFDDDQNVAPGKTYTIYRSESPGTDGREPGGKGTLVRILGTVRMRTYDHQHHVGRGVITEALDPIERGMRVAPMARRFDNVAPVTNSRDVEAKVVAAVRPVHLFGAQQILFLNVGSADGVQVGNRFFIVRHGDLWRQQLSSSPRQAGAETTSDEQPSAYPPEIIAEGIVVNVRPHSVALWVNRSTYAVVIGDKAEMRRGY